MKGNSLPMPALILLMIIPVLRRYTGPENPLIKPLINPNGMDTTEGDYAIVPAGDGRKLKRNCKNSFKNG